MKIREAEMNDIAQIQQVRNTVVENRLSDPALVTDHDVADYITRRGKGWVAVTGNRIIGFAIADLQDHNIWALFIHPGYEARGIGKQLHDLMLHWYFTQTTHSIWLSTAPGTRAEAFYRRRGWRETGMHGKGEIKFEMSIADWNIAISIKGEN